MKKIIPTLVTALFIVNACFAQLSFQSFEEGSGAMSLSDNRSGLSQKSKSPQIKSSKAELSTIMVAKISISNMLFNRINPAFEYVINPKMSAEMSFYAIPKSKLPLRPLIYKLIDRNDVDSLNGLDGIRMTGFSATPAWKFYPGKEGAPEGFYVSPFLRYSHVKFSGQLDYYNTDRQSAETAFVKDDSYATFIGGGVLVGYQWICGRVALDWWIFGVQLSTGTIQYGLTSPDGTIGTQDFEEIRDEVDKTLGKFGDVSMPVLDNSEASFLLENLLLPWARIGFSVGIAI